MKKNCEICGHPENKHYVDEDKTGKHLVCKICGECF